MSGFDSFELQDAKERICELEAAIRTIIEFAAKFGVSQQTAVVINHASFLLPTEAKP